MRENEKSPMKLGLTDVGFWCSFFSAYVNIFIFFLLCIHYRALRDGTVCCVTQQRLPPREHTVMPRGLETSCVLAHTFTVCPHGLSTFPKKWNCPVTHCVDCIFLFRGLFSFCALFSSWISLLTGATTSLPTPVEVSDGRKRVLVHYSTLSAGLLLKGLQLCKNCSQLTLQRGQIQGLQFCGQ